MHTKKDPMGSQESVTQSQRIIHTAPDTETNSYKARQKNPHDSIETPYTK